MYEGKEAVRFLSFISLGIRKGEGDTRRGGWICVTGGEAGE